MDSWRIRAFQWLQCPQSGPVLASAGPDWKHFWGAPLSDV